MNHNILKKYSWFIGTIPDSEGSFLPSAHMYFSETPTQCGIANKNPKVLTNYLKTGMVTLISFLNNLYEFLDLFVNTQQDWFIWKTFSQLKDFSQRN